MGYETISDLVITFNRNVDVHKNSNEKNESETRKSYIDPMFKLMGWNVSNQGLQVHEREVTAEYSVTDKTGKKKADYSFNLDGKPMFFVEAKDPYINIEENKQAAFQLRSYCWNAKIPVGVLTDFEEFAVYDGRYEPKATDSTNVARIKYFNYKEYVNKWDEITSLFSRESVLEGSLNSYIRKVKLKKGVLPVDEVFLKDMESWRKLLAVNIASLNPELSRREINFAVQRTIDRIVFLRICEDRGTESYGEIKGLKKKRDIYSRLMKLFRAADQKYNSGIFCFKQEKGRLEGIDTLSPKLKIEDEVLNIIIERLYYPSPYNFAVMPADILGQIYERFLGKVIEVRPDRNVSVEEKPEVRKAGGVYYTPTYIVDYIVENTIGKLVESKTPTQVAKMRFLDPACGSGSFLIQAYQYILDWHLAWYLNDDSEKHMKGKRPVLVKDKEGNVRLSIDERKQILLNNIFGVDIDFQAVEVSKLSLLLKVLEGEDKLTMQQLSLFKQRALPDLGKNIKCGNSLIGSDFYEGQQINLFDEDEMYRINPFDWKTEFSKIMDKGGFDAVIGNPPYVRQESLKDSKTYFTKRYSVYHGSADLYAYFIEKGVSLLNQGGLFSYIVANKWFRANYGNPLRRWIKQHNIVEIVDFGYLPVFKQATTYPCIIVIQKKSPTSTFQASTIKTLDFLDLKEHVAQNHYDVQQNMLDDSGWALMNQKCQDLLDKLHKSGGPLREYVNGKLYRGVLTGLNEAFVIDEATRKRLISEDPKSAEVIKPFLAGRDIKRYQPPAANKYLIFTRRGIEIENYPAIIDHLSKFKKRLLPRPKDWKGGKWQGRKPGAYQWYEIQDSIDYYAEFEKPKIIVPAIVRSASYAFDEDGFYSNDKTTIIPTEDKYLLGLISSKLLDFYMHSISSTKQGGYFEYKPMYLSNLPIHTINFDDTSDIALHDSMVDLVNQMLDLNKQLANSTLPQSQMVIRRQIEATNKQIDQLVYKLYNLNNEEIKVVNGEA